MEKPGNVLTRSPALNSVTPAPTGFDDARRLRTDARRELRRLGVIAGAEHDFSAIEAERVSA